MQVARGLEKKVHELLEASVVLGQQGSTQAGGHKEQQRSADSYTC